MINLVNNTIDTDDIDALIEWLKTNPRLTKGQITVELEEKWSKYLGKKYSVFVNSGSSANLAMFYSLLLSNRLKNKKVVVPAVSWVTTVSPLMQLGLEPILCDTDEETLGVDIKYLEKLFIEQNPSLLTIVHVLGVPNKMNEILELCEKYDVILLEDSCESVGSTYLGTKTGQFGLMSSFSTYFGHHFSTIEGGFISTDDEDLYNILKSLRAHGWDRDLEEKYQKELRKEHNIDNFKALYTFYYPGFNLRSTDLQAFIGVRQIDKLNFIINKRNENFLLYHKLIKNDYWKIKPTDSSFVSNFAYPIIHPNIKEIIKELSKNDVETRPLICGSITNQPFYKKVYGENKYLNFSNIVDEYGIYLPNNHQINGEEIEFICNIVNELHIS